MSCSFGGALVFGATAPRTVGPVTSGSSLPAAYGDTWLMVNASAHAARLSTRRALLPLPKASTETMVAPCWEVNHRNGLDRKASESWHPASQEHSTHEPAVGVTARTVDRGRCVEFSAASAERRLNLSSRAAARINAALAIPEASKRAAVWDALSKYFASSDDANKAGSTKDGPKDQGGKSTSPAAGVSWSVSRTVSGSSDSARTRVFTLSNAISTATFPSGT